MNEGADHHSVYRKIVNLSFFIYLFFVFFGTSLPFRPPVENVDQKGTSNIVNQVVFSSLFLIGIVPLWVRRKDVAGLLKYEKWLTLFLLWCFITLLWSDYRFTSFKRLFQIYTTVVICLNALLWNDSSRDIIGSLRTIIYLYVSLSILSVVFIPGAIDPKSLTWRAMAMSKNHLGQAALICTLVLIIDISGNNFKRQCINGIMLIFSLMLIFGSNSLTSILTLFFITILWIVLRMDERFRTLGIGHLYLFLTAFTALAIALVMAQFPEEIEAFLKFFGKDLTLTGRTRLWAAVFQESRHHLLLGTGFAAFWVVSNPAVLDIYSDFLWLPNQAHFGYLDILNETGLIGFILFSLMVFVYLKNLIQFRATHQLSWCFLSVLIINFQETTFFRPNVMTGVILILSYLTLYHDLRNLELPTSAFNPDPDLIFKNRIN